MDESGWGRCPGLRTNAEMHFQPMQDEWMGGTGIYDETPGLAGYHQCFPLFFSGCHIGGE